MLTDILSYMNLTFTLCFTVECVLKLVSYGPGVNRRPQEPKAIHSLLTFFPHMVSLIVSRPHYQKFYKTKRNCPDILLLREKFL